MVNATREDFVKAGKVSDLEATHIEVDIGAVATEHCTLIRIVNAAMGQNEVDAGEISSRLVDMDRSSELKVKYRRGGSNVNKHRQLVLGAHFVVGVHDFTTRREPARWIDL